MSDLSDQLRHVVKVEPEEGKTTTVPELPKGFLRRLNDEDTQKGDLVWDEAKGTYAEIPEQDLHAYRDKFPNVIYPDGVFWRDVALKLRKDVLFALKYLKCRGSGMVMPLKGDGPAIHWRDRFMDDVEVIGMDDLDREACHWLDLPQREQDKLWREREKSNTQTDSQRE